MSNTSQIWDSAPEGIYIAFTTFTQAGGNVFGQVFDPTTDREDAQTQYADAREDGDVLVLLLTDENGDLKVVDVTAEIHAEVNAYLRARGQDALAPFSPLTLDTSFLTTIQKWPDGDLGSIKDYADIASLSKVQEAVEEWASRYAHRAENHIVGVIIRMDKTTDGWTATTLMTCPAPKTQDAAPSEVGM